MPPDRLAALESQFYQLEQLLTQERARVQSSHRPVISSAERSRRVEPLQLTSGSPTSTPGSPSSRDQTALQHSWNKFCHVARKDFTTTELSLVGVDILLQLLTKYNITEAAERAQIEAQWALLQQGLESVAGGTSTPRSSSGVPRRVKCPTTTSRSSTTTPKADMIFEVPKKKPQFSKRQGLTTQPIASSNPNETTTTNHRSSVRVPLRSNTPVRSDPNVTDSSTSRRPFCFKPATAPTERPAAPKGPRHITPTTSGDVTPRGIQCAGATCAPSAVTMVPNGIRSIPPRELVVSPRSGKKSFACSPTATQVPVSSVAIGPPHQLRSRLSTETLTNKPTWPAQRNLSSRQERTPFAVEW